MQSNTCLLLLFLFASALLQLSSAASCKGAEGDPYKPHPSPTVRLYSYDSPDPSKDTSPKSGSTLHFVSYNIQSGLSLYPTCDYVLNAQAVFLQGAHFFGLQEVDSANILRCNCSQTEEMAKLTGKSTVFLNTIFYRLGLYGSAMGSAYPILEKRFSMFAIFSSEERGVTALRTQPPQLNGKFLWTLNTHFQYDSDTVRVGQSSGVVNFIKDLVAEFPNDLVVLLGDFYVVAGDESYTLLNSYLQNAWAVYNKGNPLGGPTYPSGFPEHRFDHVWYKFPENTVYNIHVQVVDSKLSDHRPLFVDFDFSTDTAVPPSTASNAASLSTALATATTAGSTVSGASTAAIGAATTASAAASATTAGATTSSAATTASATTSASATTASVTTSTSATTASVTTSSSATTAATTAAASSTASDSSTTASATTASSSTAASATVSATIAAAATTTAAATSDSSSTGDSTTADSTTADSTTADSTTADSTTADSTTADSTTADSTTADSTTADSTTADSTTADSTTADSTTNTDVGADPTDEPDATSFAVRQFNVSPVLLVTLVAVFFIYL